MARRGHIPDPLLRRQVEAMAGYGVTEAQIAGLIGIDSKTLRKHYRDELDHGHVKANVKVAKLERFADAVLPIIESIRRSGVTSLRGIAVALNNRGVHTARGGTWQVSNVRNLLRRAEWAV